MVKSLRQTQVSNSLCRSNQRVKKMTFYCRVHPDWEGTDLGKIHDHIDLFHPEITQSKTIMEYQSRTRRLFKEDIFEIAGPNRLSDSQWINTYHGRPPKLGNLIA